ncbi:hypothetical protein FJ250_11170 [bacterium]|nr:hypothetical protein [bacterium]
MAHLIQVVAVGAAACALVVGLWQGWGTLAVLKRAAISYLGFFLLGSLLLLLVRSGALVPRGRGERE